MGRRRWRHRLRPNRTRGRVEYVFLAGKRREVKPRGSTLLRRRLAATVARSRRLLKGFKNLGSFHKSPASRKIFKKIFILSEKKKCYPQKKEEKMFPTREEVYHYFEFDETGLVIKSQEDGW